MLRSSATSATRPRTPSGFAGMRRLAAPEGQQPGRRGRRPFRWFTPAFALLLGGYLFFNKTFAYLHVPGTPVFIGELVLVVGIVESIHLRLPWRRLVASSPILEVLFAFMLACSVRLLVDLPRSRL